MVQHNLVINSGYNYLNIVTQHIPHGGLTLSVKMFITYTLFLKSLQYYLYQVI